MYSSWLMVPCLKGALSATAEANLLARVTLISFSTRLSHSLILGFSAIETGVLNVISSPSFEERPVTRVLSSLSTMAATPANIFLKCFCSRGMFLLLPMISSRSSSPTK
uniref:Uncharacterized protein n=1 Tax=Ixodes ricinus TaxID=34613 RepID=A0A6B0UA80_IXORI